MFLKLLRVIMRAAKLCLHKECNQNSSYAITVLLRVCYLLLYQLQSVYVRSKNRDIGNHALP